MKLGPQQKLSIFLLSEIAKNISAYDGTAVTMFNNI